MAIGRTGDATAADPRPWIAAIRRLVTRGMEPTAISIVGGAGRFTITWRQNLWNGWSERTWSEAVTALDLEQVEDPPAVPSPPGPHLVMAPWDELAALDPDADEPIHLSSATAEGMGRWQGIPEPAPAHWWRWFRAAGSPDILGPAREQEGG
jgi:hypothetical protein